MCINIEITVRRTIWYFTILF